VEETFKHFASAVSLGVEVAAALIITLGAVEAIYAIIRSLLLRQHGLATRRQIWLRFGMWLLLGLEFELAADVVRTAISPTWSEIGQLGAIALIRTFLNYFLEKDIEKGERQSATLPSPTESEAG
jgi:uncharacterized membrane protein